jgi:hypothetical protein
MDLTEHEQILALEIAETLDDMKSLLTHQRLVRKYSESYLREQLAKAMATPKEEIRRNRAALYMYLVNQHEQAKKNNPRP